MEKLKQKVALSSSRVIASLQQAAATASFQPANQQQPAAAGHAHAEQPAAMVVEPPEEETATSSSSAAWLMAAKATAHLTEEERGILLEVFKKEEQFQRDTIKQMAGSRADADRSQQQQQQQQQQKVAAGSNRQTLATSTTPTGATRIKSPEKGRPMGTPQSSTSRAGSSSTCGRIGSSLGATPDPASQCRICRKCIPAEELCHLCSNCNQFVCEDCASYSASEQHWMCSSCRRRVSRPAIPADTLRELGLNQDSSAMRRMTSRMNQPDLRANRRTESASSSSNSSSGCSSMSQQRPAVALARARHQIHRSPQQNPKRDINPNPSQQRAPSEKAGAQKTHSYPTSTRCPATDEGPAAMELSATRTPLDRRPTEMSARELATRRASMAAPTNWQQQFGQQQAKQMRKQSLLPLGPSSQPPDHSSVQLDSYRALVRPSPQTMASGEPSGSLQTSTSVQQQQHCRRDSRAACSGATLIPIPPDQIHLRRLSDQSNLVRRSSIIADNSDGLLSCARNRSHSNIDTLGYSAYLYQSALAAGGLTNCEPQQQLQQPQQNFRYATEDSLHVQLNQHEQQRRLSDQWVQVEPMDPTGTSVYSSREYQLNSSTNNRLASIVTSCAQKSRRSSDELDSDSSSDIEDDARVLAAGGECEQPSELFAPPRALSAAYECADQTNGAPMSIPSVSVSEFSSSQQRLNQMRLRQDHDQMTSSPMQINSAIEQAIQMQQRSQQLLPSGEYLTPRRGSSGRVLPKIPGEQSRSLLDLPYDHSAVPQTDQQASTLDLPSLSSSVRRASAPEGQNIKIVVDDIDGSMRGSQGGKQARIVYGKSGELYERLVLYRDDTLDPSTRLPRGFGLHVVGGKLDEWDGKLRASVAWVLAGGPADKVGLRPGDKIVEWDGKCLVNMSYEQVADVIEASANIAELLVKPAQKLEQISGSNYVRSQRRLSQQTERDLRQMQQQQPLGASSNQNQSNNSATDTRNNDNWLPTGSANLNQRRLSGGCQLPLVSGGSAQHLRSGTGRRLPQIPGQANNLMDSLCLKEPAKQTGSTGQLEHNRSHNGYDETSGLLNAAHVQQQSRSACELYGANQALAFSQQYSTGMTGQMQTSGGMLARRDSYWATMQQQQQQQSMAMNGYQQQQQHQQQADEICGYLGLQVNVEERVAQLEISILSAINIERNLSQDYCVRVKILPENNRFKACTTQPSSDMNWKETFLFQNFPTQQINRMALEIGIWVYDDTQLLTTQIAQPLCEAIIPLQSARERNTDFWPLRPPPISAQERRRSLSDLIESHLSYHNSNQLSTSYLQQHHSANQSHQRLFNLADQSTSSNSSYRQVYDPSKYPNNVFSRERSSSNRNLPDVNKLRAQPRRASDEVAGCASNRLSRISPAPSRRSISVMNVGDNFSSTRLSSRLGSQSNIRVQARRDSTRQTGSTGTSRLSSTSRASDSTQAPVTTTPSGRRSSLAGMQSMTGYRSQKNSMSDATDQDSPKGSQRKRSQPGTPKQSSLLGEPKSRQPAAQQQLQSQPQRVAQPSPSPAATTSSPARSSSGSRRGSTDQSALVGPAQLQRRDSFAMQTLRRLKRTMSLTKGTDQEPALTRQASSSSSSTNSLNLLGEDSGVTRRVAIHTDYVGRLKLSFILTKGQFEVEVISAQGLRFDKELSQGLYTKMYLRGKSKTNKRKTRLVQPLEAPVFKQLIRYDGSMVDNKLLEVSVWQKQGGLKGKSPIGFTEIRLSELNLASLQTSWYNLRSMDVISSSSIEDS